jgi:hypothetical protein
MEMVDEEGDDIWAIEFEGGSVSPQAVWAACGYV